MTSQQREDEQQRHRHQQSLDRNRDSGGAHGLDPTRSGELERFGKARRVLPQTASSTASEEPQFSPRIVLGFSHTTIRHTTAVMPGTCGLHCP